MGNANRIYYAVALALSFPLAVPAAAKTPREPIVASLPQAQADTANAIAAACMGRGWVVRNRTEFELECVDTKAEPHASASFSFAGQAGETLIQVTTRQVVWPGPSPVFGQSSALARKVAAMLAEVGAALR